jgi:hypothetical protein
LLFQVESGENVNYFLRDNLTTAQLLLTSPKASAGVQRLVVALPAGNSGALAYFLPLNENGELADSFAGNSMVGSEQRIAC